MTHQLFCNDIMFVSYWCIYLYQVLFSTNYLVTSIINGFLFDVHIRMMLNLATLTFGNITGFKTAVSLCLPFM